MLVVNYKEANIVKSKIKEADPRALLLSPTLTTPMARDGNRCLWQRNFSRSKRTQYNILQSAPE